MRKLAVVGLLSIFVLIGAMAHAQQDKSKRPSPPGTALLKFADSKTVTVDYSRPKVNDPKTGEPRTIFGGLVPYGKVWRTGANESTTFVTDADLMVGSIHVPAGKYTLYTIPGESDWTIIINKQTGQWGTQYDDKQDLGRTTVKAGKPPAFATQFTISFDETGPKKGVMYMDWANTRVTVPIMEH
jgi:hypothetical protein